MMPRTLLFMMMAWILLTGCHSASTSNAVSEPEQTYTTAEGLKITPITEIPLNDVAQMLDMQLWKFRVIPVPGRSWYSYTLFLHEEGKPDKEVASFLHGGDISMQKSQDMTPFITGIGLVALDQPDGEKQKYKVRLISSRAGAWTNFSLPDAGHSVGYDPRPPLIAGSFRLRHIFAKTLTHPSQGIPYAKETYLCLKIEALASPPKRVAQRNER